MLPRSLRLALRLAPSLAAMVLLLLLLGLPRLLVVCSAGGGHVAFAHAPSACCHHGHAHAGVHLPRGGAPMLLPDASGDHTELAVELAPAPRPGANTVCPPAAWLGDSCWAIDAASDADDGPRPARTTGPPRPDPRLRLRTTTLLLL